MASQSATPTYAFASAMALALEATFDRGRLTADGGLPWLLEADRALGLCHLSAPRAGVARPLPGGTRTG